MSNSVPLARRGAILVRSFIGLPAQSRGREWSVLSRRTFASERSDRQSKDGNQEGKKQEAPKAGPGFFETFRKSFAEQMRTKSLEDVKFKEAREKVDQATEEAQAAAARAMERATEDAKKRAEELDEKTRPARQKIGQKVEEGLGIVGGVLKKVGENPVVQAGAEATMKAAQVILDAHDTIDKKSEELEKKIVNSQIGQAISKTLGTGEASQGPVVGKPIDTETTGMTLREETPWERRLRKFRENPFTGPLVQTAERAADLANDRVEALGDRVFGESETSLAMAEIKREDPRFNIQRFLDKLQNETIPLVLKAILENDIEKLKPICTERALSALGHGIQERIKDGKFPDPHILDLEEVALSEAKLIDGEPVLIISFHAQQVHCVRNKKGEIIEGGDSKVQQIYYIWAMVRLIPLDPSLPPEWKLHEMAIQHQIYLLA